mgnify:CR=1 FL=1
MNKRSLSKSKPHGQVDEAEKFFDVSSFQNALLCNAFGESNKTIVVQIDDSKDISLQSLHVNNIEILKIHKKQWSYSPPSPRQNSYSEIDISLATTKGIEIDSLVIFTADSETHPLTLWETIDSILGMNGKAAIVLKFETERKYRLNRWMVYISQIAERFGYVLIANKHVDNAAYELHALQFRKESRPRWRIKHVRQSDWQNIANLFQEIFGSPMTLDLWKWKYSNGRGNAILAEKDGRVVAHYGGIYRDIQLFGEPDWALQICDVMVAPTERGVFTKNGPFNLMARTAAEIYGPLGFGFPNERHAKLAERADIGESMGEMVELQWKPRKTKLGILYRIKSYSVPNKYWQQEVNHCWKEMRQSLSDQVVGVRDWDYIQYRYINHPHTVYEIIGISNALAARPFCIVVFKRNQQDIEVMDIIASKNKMPAAIGALKTYFSKFEVTNFILWITKNQLGCFLRSGPAIRSLNINVPNSSWTQHPNAGVMKDKWWLTSGDTDFH